MNLRPLGRLLPAIALLLVTALSGCSAAPEIGISTNQPGDLFAQAVDAAYKGDFDYIKTCVEGDARYLQAYDHDGRTLLHYAAEGGHADIVRYLLEKGAYATAQDNDGTVPIELAMQGGASTEILDLLREAAVREAGQ